MQRQEILIRWLVLDVGCYKLSADGSIHGHNEPSSCGGIIKDEGGGGFLGLLTN